MTVKTSQKCPCVHIRVNSQNRQLTDFDLYIATKVHAGRLILLYLSVFSFIMQLYGHSVCLLTNYTQ